MIDAENLIFANIATALRAAYPGIWVVGEYIDVPADFPAVSIVEADNSVFRKMSTLEIENAASVMYEVNVYSNLARGKKRQAKAIIAAISAGFAKMNFVRKMCNPVSNLQDATIYRMIARYNAVIDEDFWIYTD